MGLSPSVRNYPRLIFGALLVVTFCQASNALESPELVGMHIGTWHDAVGFCSNTPGTYAKWVNGMTLGTFRNSECENYSFYVGKTYETDLAGSIRAAVTIGAITGYRAADVLPLVAPSLSIAMPRRAAVRITYIPKVAQDGANALNFAVETHF